MSHHKDVGNQTQIIYRVVEFSQPLCHLSTPPNPIFLRPPLCCNTFLDLIKVSQVSTNELPSPPHPTDSLWHQCIVHSTQTVVVLYCLRTKNKRMVWMRSAQIGLFQVFSSIFQVSTVSWTWEHRTQGHILPVYRNNGKGMHNTISVFQQLLWRLNKHPQSTDPRT